MKKVDTRPRPLNTRDILRYAIRLYRSHFLVLVGISAIVKIPSIILQFSYVSFIRSSHSSAPIWDYFSDPSHLAIATLLAGFGFLEISALTFAVSELHYGIRASVAGAYKRAFPLRRTLFAICILFVLVDISAFAQRIFSLFHVQFPFAILLMPLLNGFVFSLLILFAQPFILENFDVEESLIQANKFIRNSLGRIFRVVFVLSIFSAWGGWISFLSLVFVPIDFSKPDQIILGNVISYSLAAFFAIAASSFSQCALTPLYYDLISRGAWSSPEASQDKIDEAVA